MPHRVAPLPKLGPVAAPATNPLLREASVRPTDFVSDHDCVIR
jgi:hypothetical protein